MRNIKKIISQVTLLSSALTSTRKVIYKENTPEIGMCR
jgi:hypothetical protein